MRQDDRQILGQLAFKSYESRDYKKAYLYYSELYREDLLNERDFNSMLVSVKYLNKTNADNFFIEGTKKFPQSLHIKRNYIDFLIRKENYEKAEKLVDEILSEYPNDFYAIDLKSIILGKTNRIESAIELMERKISSPETIKRSFKGLSKEMFFSFKTYFQVLEERLDITKTKQTLFELLISDGKGVDNINFIFDKADFPDTSLFDKEVVIPNTKIASLVREYENIFHKLDTLFKRIENVQIDRTLIVEKRAIVNNLKEFIHKVKGLIASLYNEEKKVQLTKSFQSKKVFLSYSRLDKEVALKIYEALKKKGYDMFLDEYKLEINDYLQTELESRIKESDYVVSLVSKNSLLSEWVGHESIRTLIEERYENTSKKYISVVIDKDIFKWDYYVTLIDELDVKLDNLFELTKKAFKLKVSTRLYDVSRERLIQLRSNLGDILYRIKEYLSIDFTNDIEFDKNIDRIEDYVNKPRPTYKKAA
ncbi:MAG: TIR domain-containing protein [Cytophagales bacterium]|nr:TIR domain-containing protein [Cytophagales bacterium]